jgi:hypothetical protein
VVKRKNPSFSLAEPAKPVFRQFIGKLRNQLIQKSKPENQTQKQKRVKPGKLSESRFVNR